MTIKVRAMDNADLDIVYAIEMAAHRAPWSRDILSDCIFVGYDCRVLEVDNETSVEVVGYIISRYNQNTCHILNICIAPEAQGKGYGHLLLQALIDSPGKSIDTLLLEVRPSNEAALRLYQKMGFQQVGVKRNYYRDAESIEDAIVLQKNI